MNPCPKTDWQVQAYGEALITVWDNEQTRWDTQNTYETLWDFTPTNPWSTNCYG